MHDFATFPHLLKLFTRFRFMFEVAVRMRTAGIAEYFFNKSEWGWNWCDIFLVCVSLVEMLLLALGAAEGENRATISSLKAVRIIRVAPGTYE